MTDIIHRIVCMKFYKPLGQMISVSGINGFISAMIDQILSGKPGKPARHMMAFGPTIRTHPLKVFSCAASLELYGRAAMQGVRSRAFERQVV